MARGMQNAYGNSNALSLGNIGSRDSATQSQGLRQYNTVSYSGTSLTGTK